MSDELQNVLKTLSRFRIVQDWPGAKKLSLKQSKKLLNKAQLKK